MNRLILPVIFVLSIIVVGIFLSGTSETVNTKIDPNDITPFAVDDALPASSIIDAQGKKVAIEQVVGSPTLVTFWNSSCNECVLLLTEQKNILTGTALKPVLINIQDQPDVAAAKLNELGVTFPNYFDEQGTTFRSWSGTIPASYYISGNRIKYFFPGRMSAEHLRALLTLN